MYWAITTMTSVGYGDITPSNTPEKAFICVAMMISSIVFAYFVGNMASIISSMGATNTIFSTKIEWVRQYVKHNDLPPDLGERVLQFYAHCWKALPSHPFSESRILGELSPSLQKVSDQKNKRGLVGNKESCLLYA